MPPSLSNFGLLEPLDRFAIDFDPESGSFRHAHDAADVLEWGFQDSLPERVLRTVELEQRLDGPVP